jgi:hypothetical protein
VLSRLIGVARLVMVAEVVGCCLPLLRRVKLVQAVAVGLSWLAVEILLHCRLVVVEMIVECLQEVAQLAPKVNISVPDLMVPVGTWLQMMMADLPKSSLSELLHYTSSYVLTKWLTVAVQQAAVAQAEAAKQHQSDPSHTHLPTVPACPADSSSPPTSP